MAHRYLAFDIETAKIIPGADFNWKAHRPLGITCIASQSIEDDEPRIWLTRESNGTPAPRMRQADVVAFVQYLSRVFQEGFVSLSWNGLAFDWDVLAEESGLVAECKNLARHHVDMMFQVVCEKGYPVALQNAAIGLNLPGKLAGVEGVDAPVLWAGGQAEVVIKYVAQDVRTTLAVALKSEKQRSLVWRTRQGKTSTMPLHRGWLSVEEALQLPLPDTSWMSNPLPRRDFTAWLDRE